MNTPSPDTLLAEFVHHASEDAFRALVGRYTNLVYSTALRLVHGNAHQAQDICQTVFIDLVQKAAALPPQVQLGGWLHRHTCFVAANQRRQELRRQARESIAAAELHAMPDPNSERLQDWLPTLDHAINQLGEDDRTAIVLRYFEQFDWRTVGTTLGTSENTARMRVQRALDRLHGALVGQGLRLAVGPWSEALGTHAVTQAPSGLATTLAQSALAAAVATTGVSIATTTGATAGTTLFAKVLAVAAALALAGWLGPTMVRQQHQIERLARHNQQLQGEVDRLQTAPLPAVESPNASPDNEPSRTDSLAEKLRLRAEVADLRRQITALRTAGSAPIAQSTAAPPSTPLPKASARPFHVHLVKEESEEATAELSGPVPGSESDSNAQLIYRVDAEPLLGPESVRSVQPSADPLTGRTQIDIQLTDEGARRFATITRENLNRRLALAVDGQVYMAPVIRSEISGGHVVLSGSFTEPQARDLADRIDTSLKRN